jgi:hypothetical protein
LTVVKNSLLTHCQLDGPLIKYSQFPDILHILNVQPLNRVLQFDCIDESPEPGTDEATYRGPSSFSANGISQDKTLCEAEQHRTYKCV